MTIPEGLAQRRLRGHKGDVTKGLEFWLLLPDVT